MRSSDHMLPESDARIIVSHARISEKEENWDQKDPRLATLERTSNLVRSRTFTC